MMRRSVVKETKPRPGDVSRAQSFTIPDNITPATSRRRKNAVSESESPALSPRTPRFSWRASVGTNTLPLRYTTSPVIPKTKMHHYSPSEVAQELSIIDSELLRKIKPEELEHGAWMKENKHQLAPNVLAMVQASNKLAMLVPSEVLAETTPQARARVIAIFVKIASKCYKLRNYNSLKAILAGLQSTPVFRLKRTWKEVTAKSNRTYSDLTRLMSEDFNYKEYRADLKAKMAANVSCIPFLGVLLTTIVQLDSAASAQIRGRRCSGVEGYTIIEAITVRNRLSRIKNDSTSNRYTMFSQKKSSYPANPRVSVPRHMSESSNNDTSLLQHNHEGGEFRRISTLLSSPLPDIDSDSDDDNDDQNIRVLTQSPKLRSPMLTPEFESDQYGAGTRFRKRSSEVVRDERSPRSSRSSIISPRSETTGGDKRDGKARLIRRVTTSEIVLDFEDQRKGSKDDEMTKQQVLSSLCLDGKGLTPFGHDHGDGKGSRENENKDRGLTGLLSSLVLLDDKELTPSSHRNNESPCETGSKVCEQVEANKMSSHLKSLRNGDEAEYDLNDGVRMLNENEIEGEVNPKNWNSTSPRNGGETSPRNENGRNGGDISPSSPADSGVVPSAGYEGKSRSEFNIRNGATPTSPQAPTTPTTDSLVDYSVIRCPDRCNSEQSFYANHRPVLVSRSLENLVAVCSLQSEEFEESLFRSNSVNTLSRRPISALSLSSDEGIGKSDPDDVQEREFGGDACSPDRIGSPPFAFARSNRPGNLNFRYNSLENLKEEGEDDEAFTSPVEVCPRKSPEVDVRKLTRSSESGQSPEISSSRRLSPNFSPFKKQSPSDGLYSPSPNVSPSEKKQSSSEGQSSPSSPRISISAVNGSPLIPAAQERDTKKPPSQQETEISSGDEGTHTPSSGNDKKSPQLPEISDEIPRLPRTSLLLEPDAHSKKQRRKSSEIQEPERKRSRRRASNILAIAFAAPEKGMNIRKLLMRYQMSSLGRTIDIESQKELRLLITDSVRNSEGQNYKLSYDREPQ